MTGPIYTPSMLASAMMHYDQRKAWTRCHRRSDGLVFVSFVSSRKPRPGKQPRTYCTTETTCTCPGFSYHHGMCSHLLAVKMEIEQARSLARRPRRQRPVETDTAGTVSAF